MVLGVSEEEKTLKTLEQGLHGWGSFLIMLMPWLQAAILC